MSVISLTMGGGALNAYPIGSIYLTLNPDNPATYFGGVWEQIQGKFLLSADSSHGAGSTGGSFNKTLSTDNLPSHNHSIGSHTHSLNNHSHTWSGTTSENGSHHHNYRRYHNGADLGFQNLAFWSWQQTGSWTSESAPDASLIRMGGTDQGMSNSGAHQHTISGTTSGNNGSTGSGGSGSTGLTGSGSAFDVTPPYLAVYMWKRVG